MNDYRNCPVCLNAHGTKFRELRADYDSTSFECEVCGKFRIARPALVTYFHPDRPHLSAMQRAALSHRLRSGQSDEVVPLISMRWIQETLPSLRPPSPAIQVANLIREIGDHVANSGEPYIPQPATVSVTGAINLRALNDIIRQLSGKGLIFDAGQVEKLVDGVRQIYMNSYDLTLDGWEVYESESRGKFAGNYGFLAMKFNDAVLSPFMNEIVKPALKKEIGYELVDMLNVARAGIIDNIMRAQIRDAAFVVVDLTHDNFGAYWEAGYAEGLGKPVIYVCETAKFERAKTHFDVNHCTTVLWERDEPKDFVDNLIATLRRSLNLFTSG